MTTDEVLSELDDRGLRVEVSAGKLVLKGKKERMTPNLIAVLRWHKAELLGRLAPPEPAALPPKPPIIYWQMSGDIVLVSLPCTPEANFTSHAHYVRNCRPWIPLGAAGWRTNPDAAWQDIASLPASWGLAHLSKVEVIADEEEETT